MPPVNLDYLYEILRDIASKQDIWSYSDLSAEYNKRFRVYHPPHGSWDVPLLQINTRTHAARLPALSAVITYEPSAASNYGPPGKGFWGTPGVPPRPARADDREDEWLKILNQVHAATWPPQLP
ncbi:hypothetical protein [Hyalangium rubrum]|uniref:Uncharacterized protein n=1 Tax=Hyalangium rubrum TaxID=3103134 RepID=A0ABU5GX66_9BACT|nr:hypothetical protein [Hyalangium sp. s54d21]MDY7225780.1 hypothetical protein [Hyalangium sp. s54d21]